MMDLFEAVKQWPVIVQGALGSALFYIVISLGGFVWGWVSKFWSKHSMSARKVYLVNQQVKLHLIASKSIAETSEALLWIFYRASRPVLIALIWLVYGLIMDSIFPLSGVIGYIICIFYLFKAYQIVGPIENHINSDNCKAKIDEINEEITSIENGLNKNN